jgi:hypothetical protein
MDHVQAKHLQRQFLSRLKGGSIPRSLYSGVANCGPDHCGRDECSRACRYSTLHSDRDEVAAVAQLIRQTGQQAYEIRVTRGGWTRQVGELQAFDITVARDWNRRALNSLYNPDLIAVGMFKVSLATNGPDVFWVGEIHQIVVGETKQNLDRAFSGGRPDERIANMFLATEVEDLTSTIQDILKLRCQSWHDPQRADTEISWGRSEWQSVPVVRPAPVTRERWDEFYAWLLSLSYDATVIRYGCSRKFNALQKKPRIVGPTIATKLKQRHSAGHLEPYQFGGPKWENRDPQQVGYVKRNVPYRPGSALDDYFDLDDE